MLLSIASAIVIRRIFAEYVLLPADYGDLAPYERDASPLTPGPSSQSVGPISTKRSESCELTWRVEIRLLAEDQTLDRNQDL